MIQLSSLENFTYIVHSGGCLVLLVKLQPYIIFIIKSINLEFKGFSCQIDILAF